MSNYLTVQEASLATGKSARTIRRLCYEDTSKDFITHDEKNRLLVDANFLAQHYPLTTIPKSDHPTQNGNSQRVDTSKVMTIDTAKPQEAENLALKLALLQQELKHKEELYLQVNREKDKRIETLERTLLMLGEGQKKEVLQSIEQVPSASASAPEPKTTQLVEEQQPEPEPAKKKWWKLF